VRRPIGIAVGSALDGVPERVHRRREVRQLLEVQLAERLEHAFSALREPQANCAQVVGVGVSGDQPCRLRAVDQSHGAVMAQ
jgi:hypothetical protein